MYWKQYPSKITLEVLFYLRRYLKMGLKFENGVVDIKGDKIMEGSEVIHPKWKKVGKEKKQSHMLHLHNIIYNA